MCQLLPGEWTAGWSLASGWTLNPGQEGEHGRPLITEAPHSSLVLMWSSSCRSGTITAAYKSYQWHDCCQVIALQTNWGLVPVPEELIEILHIDPQHCPCLCSVQAELSVNSFQFSTIHMQHTHTHKKPFLICTWTLKTTCVCVSVIMAHILHTITAETYTALKFLAETAVCACVYLCVCVHEWVSTYRWRQQAHAWPMRDTGNHRGLQQRDGGPTVICHSPISYSRDTYRFWT